MKTAICIMVSDAKCQFEELIPVFADSITKLMTKAVNGSNGEVVMCDPSKVSAIVFKDEEMKTSTSLNKEKSTKAKIRRIINVCKTGLGLADVVNCAKEKNLLISIRITNNLLHWCKIGDNLTTLKEFLDEFNDNIDEIKSMCNDCYIPINVFKSAIQNVIECLS
jgi:hypothetical protein